MNKKKVLSLVLVATLLLTAVAGTLAYFTDTEEAENVFTVGNVDIMLKENGMINGKLTADHQYRQELADYEVMPGAEVDKNVWIDNVGSQAAYVRVIMSIDKDLTPNWNAEWETQWEHQALDYGDHWVHVFQSKEPVAGKSSTVHLLDSVSMSAEMKAVNVDADYKIPVKAYAIQSIGLDKDQAYAQLDKEFPKAMPILVKDTAELLAAIAEVNSGEPTEISLADGIYAVGQYEFQLANKEITLRGSENAIIDLTSWGGPTYHTNAQNAVTTFDGVTMKWAEFNTKYQGFAGAPTLVYKNCTLYGTQSVDGNADFINCVFQAENTSEKAYAVYTRATGTVTFTDCTFYTDGRAIMMYSDNPTADMKVVANNCTFYDNGNYDDKPKAVVETGTNAKESTFEIVINNCSVYGFECNESNSPLWGNKDKIGKDRLTVTVDGVDVYANTVYEDGEHKIDLSVTEFEVKGSDIKDNLAVIKVNSNSTATISGQGTISVTADAGISNAIAVWARNGGDVIIEDGTYILERAEGNTNELELIYASDAQNDGNETTITIKGGTFKCDNAYKTLNIHGSGANNDAEAFIYVMGGTFWEFNPETDSEDDHVIIPEGYMVLKEEKADGTWYTVVAE